MDRSNVRCCRCTAVDYCNSGRYCTIFFDTQHRRVWGRIAFFVVVQVTIAVSSKAYIHELEFCSWLPSKYASNSAGVLRSSSRTQEALRSSHENPPFIYNSGYRCPRRYPRNSQSSRSPVENRHYQGETNLDAVNADLVS